MREERLAHMRSRRMSASVGIRSTSIILTAQVKGAGRGVTSAGQNFARWTTAAAPNPTGWPIS